jgi:hypothetical protein
VLFLALRQKQKGQTQNSPDSCAVFSNWKNKHLEPLVRRYSLGPYGHQSGNVSCYQTGLRGLGFCHPPRTPWPAHLRVASVPRTPFGPIHAARAHWDRAEWSPTRREGGSRMSCHFGHCGSPIRPCRLEPCRMPPIGFAPIG